MGFQNPLRDFWGKLDHWVPRRDERYNRTIIDLGFTELRVVASVEPYKLPTTQISIPHSTYLTSSWGVFATSVNKFLTEEEEWTVLEGATLHMVLTDNHNFGTARDTNEPIIRSCWEVVEVQGRETGGGAISPIQKALDLLDGKSDQDYYQVALADPIIKKDGNLVTQLLNNTFLPAVEASGQAKKDENGIWHTKPSES